MLLILVLLLLMLMMIILALTLMLLIDAFPAAAYAVVDDSNAMHKCQMMLAIFLVPMLWC